MRAIYTLAALLAALVVGPAMAAPTVYVALGSGDRVVAIDAATDAVTASYSGVANPHGLAATPDGEYLVAGSLNEDPEADADGFRSRLYFIHPAHGHVMLTIPVPAWTHHVSISPDGRWAIATHSARDFVSVVDLQARRFARKVGVGTSPNYALFSPDGKLAYVTASGRGQVAEIDTADWSVRRTLAAGPGPAHMVWSADHRRLYVTNPGAGKVSVVDVGSGKLVATYEVGAGLHGLDLGDDGRTLFASAQGAGLLAAIDTRTGARRTLELGPAPYHLEAIDGTGKVYVASRNKPEIRVVDQASLELLGKIDLPAGEGHQMAVVR